MNGRRRGREITTGQETEKLVKKNTKSGIAYKRKSWCWHKSASLLFHTVSPVGHVRLCRCVQDIISYRRHNHRTILIIDPVNEKKKKKKYKEMTIISFSNVWKLPPITKFGQNKEEQNVFFILLWNFKSNTQVSASGLRALGV